MTPDQPKQPTFQLNGLTIVSLSVAIIFAVLFFRGCKGDTKTETIYVKADSALQEENRRLRDSNFLYKQYQWKTDILQTQLGETEKVIVGLTRSLQQLEGRIRKPIIVTDSVECKELVGLVNNYADSVIFYRFQRDTKDAQYEAWLTAEKGFSANLRKLLDSCRGAVQVIAPAIAAVKPRGVLYLGIGGATNLGFVYAGPEVMYKDKRDRLYGFSYGVGNTKPVYGIKYLVPIKLKR